MPPTRVTVEPLETEDLASVRALVIEGLTERWGHYEPKFNPDLEDLHSFYRGSVVVVAKEGRTVIGVGILCRENGDTGRIVRMSVCARLRRTGVGGLLLDRLLAAASEHGFKNVLLETTASWTSAVEFYKKRGFVPTRLCDGDQYFVYTAGEA